MVWEGVDRRSSRFNAVHLIPLRRAVKKRRSKTSTALLWRIASAHHQATVVARRPRQRKHINYQRAKPVSLRQVRGPPDALQTNATSPHGPIPSDPALPEVKEDDGSMPACIAARVPTTEPHRDRAKLWFCVSYDCTPPFSRRAANLRQVGERHASVSSRILS